MHGSLDTQLIEAGGTTMKDVMMVVIMRKIANTGTVLRPGIRLTDGRDLQTRKQGLQFLLKTGLMSLLPTRETSNGDPVPFR